MGCGVGVGLGVGVNVTVGVAVSVTVGVAARVAVGVGADWVQARNSSGIRGAKGSKTRSIRTWGIVA